MVNWTNVQFYQSQLITNTYLFKRNDKDKDDNEDTDNDTRF